MFDLAVASSLLEQLKKGSRATFVRCATRRLLRSRVRALLPLRYRRRLAGSVVDQVSGNLPAKANGLVTIVSHEFAAAGAPKVLLSIINSCRQEGIAVVVVGPRHGPYVDKFAASGAVVVVSRYATTTLCPSIILSEHSDVVLCNTVVCHPVIASIAPKKAVWYLHETGLLQTLRKSTPTLPKLLRTVADVWVASCPGHWGYLRPSTRGQFARCDTKIESNLLREYRASKGTGFTD